MFENSGNNFEINPDEVFLDSTNVSAFETERFEGTMERALSKRSVFVLAAIFFLVVIGYAIRVGDLQVARGESLAIRSRDNNLNSLLIIADRGLIRDRNGKLLVWNELDGTRSYIEKPGFAHILGYIGLPKDVENNIYVNQKIGITGLEKLYDETLSGEHGLKLEETRVNGNLVSESIQKYPTPGESIDVSIDSELQSAGYDAVSSVVERLGYVGGGLAMMDIDTGELVVMVSYPDYDPNVMSRGEDRTAINQYLNDERKPFLNRVTSGLYAPGSTIKPYVAVAALQESVITPNTKILSTGSIEIPNPYFPDLSTTFVEADRKAHGLLRLKDALAVSSNIFFYEVGGGFEEQRGVGIRALNDYFEKFGFGQKVNLFGENEPTGTIPSPEWKARVFDGEDWHLGDTYHTSIGQYGLQVTPLQILRAVSVIASDGYLIEPKLTKDGAVNKERVPINDEHFDPVREGMREAVLRGTVWRLNFPEVEIAGKTGTAEVGVSNKFINSWVTGFFPYDNPKYAFALVMERGTNSGENGASSAMRDFMSWLIINKPEYIN